MTRIREDFAAAHRTVNRLEWAVGQQALASGEQDARQEISPLLAEIRRLIGDSGGVGQKAEDILATATRCFQSKRLDPEQGRIARIALQHDCAALATIIGHRAAVEGG